MRYWLMTALAITGAAASAQTTPVRTGPAQGADATPQRIRSVMLRPGEVCPPSSGSDVVVCYREGNPYRIPPQLRREEIPTANQSWVNRTATIDQVGRVAGGLPDTCSPVGTGGQSGCFQARAQAYAAEKRERERAERVAPGGDE